MNSGDTAWVLVSAALVLLMTPGLALFYGGMVRARSVLNMMMMSFSAIAIVTVLWVGYGFSLSFGVGGNSLIGDLGWAGMGEVLGQQQMVNGAELTVPTVVFAVFQLMFAIITPALISGAIADRAKFLGWSVFVALWVTLVYFPVAHWVFDFGDAEGNHAGWLASLGVLDFAGGTAVHINAGAAGLALALVLGKRNGWPGARFRPHNLPLVLLGAGLLWFGWFGFNAGSALSAGTLAGLTFLNTQVATAAAVIGWLIAERVRDGHATSLGAASGAVAGLVAITPACAYLVPWSAALLGLISGAVCAMTISLKYRLGFDDSLDVVGVHLIGGLIGCLYLGFMATTRADAAGAASANGLFYGGGVALLGKQLTGALAVGIYSFVVAGLLALAIERTIGFRLTKDEEEQGIDVVEHAESAYELGHNSTAGSFRGALASATRRHDDMEVSA